MTFDDIILMAYVDGELDPGTKAAVEKALETDPAAQAKVAMFREVSGLLRSALADKYYQDELERLRLVHPSRRPARRRAMLAAAACLVVGMIGFGGGRLSLQYESPLDSLRGEIAEYHELFQRETRHLVEVSVDDRNEFESWMGERLGRRFAAPDLSAAGLTFVGGRMLVVSGKPVAEMMYTRSAGLPVALCITPMDRPGVPLSVDERGELTTAAWTDGQFAFVVVGELDPPYATMIAQVASSQTGL